MNTVRIHDCGKVKIEVNDIAAFLESLTGPFPDQMMPRLPPTAGDLIGAGEAP